MNRKYRMTPKSFITYKGIKQELKLNIEIDLPGEMTEKEAIIFTSEMLSMIANLVGDKGAISSEELKKIDIIFQEIKA